MLVTIHNPSRRVHESYLRNHNTEAYERNQQLGKDADNQARDEAYSGQQAPIPNVSSSTPTRHAPRRQLPDELVQRETLLVLHHGNNIRGSGTGIMPRRHGNSIEPHWLRVLVVGEDESGADAKGESAPSEGRSACRTGGVPGEEGGEHCWLREVFSRPRGWVLVE